MKKSKKIAKERLHMMAERARMFASCREAFVALISGMLEIACPKFDAYEFYKKALGTRGNCYVDPLGEVTDEWAQVVVATALTYVQE
jgi:hypothetical protein